MAPSAAAKHTSFVGCGDDPSADAGGGQDRCGALAGCSCVPDHAGPRDGYELRQGGLLALIVTHSAGGNPHGTSGALPPASSGSTG